MPSIFPKSTLKLLTPPPSAGVLLCSDGADVTRDTVAGKIEDATGSELLDKVQ